MAGGDHDAAVKIFGTHDIRNRRSRGNVKKICVCTACHKTCNKGILEHIARTSGILADNDLALMLLAVIPAEITADLIGMFDIQGNIGFAAEAVCTEIFSHI